MNPKTAPKKKSHLKKRLMLMASLVFLLFCGFLYFGGANLLYVFGTEKNEIVTIQDASLDLVKTEEGAHRYLVYTDAGVFENTNCDLRWKLDSSELHNKLLSAKGKKVRIYYYGWREKWFLKWYPNIYKIEEVSS
mgnify:CR=1 FL=1